MMMSPFDYDRAATTLREESAQRASMVLDKADLADRRCKRRRGQ
jgi:hypothetical protein